MFKYLKRIEKNQSLYDYALYLINQDIFYKTKKRQNNKLIINDHLIPISDNLEKIIINSEYKDIAKSFGLLHDIIEDFPHLIKSANPYIFTDEELSVHHINYIRSLNYLLKPAKEKGKKLIYCIDKSTKRKVEHGKKYSENIFRLNDEKRLAENLIIVNMKNIDINSNTNPFEKAMKNQQSFIVKKIRNALRYLYYDLPKLEEIITENKNYTINNDLLFDYNQSNKILQENYSNIFTFLQHNPIYENMKKNIEIGKKPLGNTSLLDIKFYREALIYLLENNFSDKFKNLEKAIILVSL